MQTGFLNQENPNRSSAFIQAGPTDQGTSVITTEKHSPNCCSHWRPPVSPINPVSLPDIGEAAVKMTLQVMQDHFALKNAYTQFLSSSVSLWAIFLTLTVTSVT